MIGQTLSHYRILEKIGAGGMGEVYRAEDLHLARDVAIKVLPARTLVDEQARRRFRKEAEALSKLNHRNIQTVHDFDTQEGVDFLVVEFVPGPTLAEKLGANALPEKEIASLGVQIAAALEEAHERGVVHRDLKPGNIKVTPKGQVKVLDFGLAKLLKPALGPGFSQGTATTESFTETHAAAGTLPYMAPEQLRGEAVDHRSDIWAAGVVLYEMATSRRPFEAKLATALAADIQHKPAAPPRHLNPQLSSRLEEVILKCLEKELENRYQSAKELAVDLRRVTAPTPVIAAARRPTVARRLVLTGLRAIGVLLAVWLALNVGSVRERLSRIFGRDTPRIGSLAVLPLKNLMGDSEQDYFVEGMHEALVTELSKISALKVISRTSAMRYKETDKSLPQVARELNVDGVIEGSVLRAGDQVRITVQLIHGPTDRHLWAESYDRDLRDVLALTSEVARAVTREIRVTLSPQEHARLARTRPVNPEAHEAYLRGRYLWHNRRTEEGFKKSLEYFQAALQKDANYAPAYAGLSDVYFELGDPTLPRTKARDEFMAKSKTAARKALESDDTLADAHVSLAWAYMGYDWDWAAAERHFKRAVELNPNDALAHQGYSRYLMAMGRPAEALPEGKRALELDPLSPFLGGSLGYDFYFARQYDLAIEQFQRTLEMHPQALGARTGLAQAYLEKGMHEEAIAQLKQVVALSKQDPLQPLQLAQLAHAYGRAGRKRQASEILQQLLHQARRRPVSPFSIAWIYTGLGEKDPAFEWLQKAAAERSALLYLRVDPRFDPLRSEPRFQDLLRRMNFPP